MNHFTIRDIENLCGIKAHTLRIWEQRYKLVAPKRKDSQHRFYDNDDLKEFLRISFLYHNGFKISKIAALGTEEIQRIVENFSAKEENHASFVHQLIEAGMDFDKEKFEKIINYLVLKIGFEKCIIEVLYPFLHRIGFLWVTNHIIPAQEHFTSNIIREKIIIATAVLQPEPANETMIIVFAPFGEQHEIPLLTANYFFRKNNIRTVYFGINVKAESLVEYLNVKPATHLYAHLTTSLSNERLMDYLLLLNNLFPEMKIIVSGPGSKVIEKNIENLLTLASLDDMIDFAKATSSATLV